MAVVHVVNHSTLVSDADVSTMAGAVDYQLRNHVAPAWGRHSWPVVVGGAGGVQIGIFDDPDQAGALGWHTEDGTGTVYGKVFARPVLDNGGTALTGAFSVASVLSHEVAEAFIDARVNLWADNGYGRAYALEVGDPVESDWYEVAGVSVSNFVYPAWFDPQAKAGAKLDHLGNCAQPFQMTPGGYVVIRSEGKTQAIYGENLPAWRMNAGGGRGHSRLP